MSREFRTNLCNDVNVIIIKNIDVNVLKCQIASTQSVKNTRDIRLYYTFEALLILFFVIFEDDKNDNFLRGDKSFRTLKRTKSRQNRVNSVTSKHLLCHFRTSQTSSPKGNDRSPETSIFK